MTRIWTEKRPGQTDRRTSDRKTVVIPARLTWKDRRGTTRFATVVTRNVSPWGVSVEASAGLSIPLYRLVHFQLDRKPHFGDPLPQAPHGCVLSAVYRVSPASASGRQELALRLLVDTRVESAAEPQRATA